MLAGLGAIVGSFIIGIATYIGRNALSDFQSQRQLERKMVHAENLLTSAYDMQLALEYIRGPFHLAHELSLSESDLNERGILEDKSPDERQRFITANVIYVRAKAVNDVFVNAQKLIPFAAAFFEAEIKNSFSSLLRQRHVVQNFADAYAHGAGTDPDFIQRVRSAIWMHSGTTDEPDEVSSAVDTAITALENQLFQVIRN